MRAHAYFLISSVFFAAIAVIHMARLLGGWGFTIGGFAVPAFFSFAGVLIAGSLAIWGLKLGRDHMPPSHVGG